MSARAEDPHDRRGAPAPDPAQPTGPGRNHDRAEADSVGYGIDPRFSFANERTFLAWNRTALALISAGAAAAAFLHTDLPGAKVVVALPLIVLGAVLAATSYRRWERNERAMRLGEPIAYDDLPRGLAVAIAVMALVIATVVVVDVVAS